MIYEGKCFYFRMGDKVKIVDASFFGVSKHIGKTAVVRAVCFDGMLKLESSGANIGTYHPSSLKLIEGAPVKFKLGDNVKVIGASFQGNANFIGLDGVVMNVNVYGDYRIKFVDGISLSFPSSSLELIKSYTIGQLKAYEDFQKLTDELKAIGPLTNKIGVTPTNTVPKKVLKSPLKKEKIIPLKDLLSAFNTPGYKLKQEIKGIYEEMSELITAKNENYGDSFSKQYQKYGMASVEMRLNDKFMRLEQLVAGDKDKVGESIEDTLKDIIGYATLALIELEDKG